MSRKIEVQIIGDSKSLEAALGRSQQKTSRFGKGLAVASKVAAGALLGLGLAAKVGFDEINASQKVMAQTNAVIESTGGVAKVSAKHVDDLAQSLLAVSGVDDETIAAGENMLLTFRNIRNEAGKGNDIFDQTTKATLDLSVAMGKDMPSAAILVGKALNDPIKGLTALRRVGVQFTDQQENTIKKLVEGGHTMKAQKIILGELTKEFGGSAKAAGGTLSGQLGKLRESFADVAANVVTALLPALGSVLGVITSVTGWMKQNAEATKILVGVIAGLAAGIILVNAVYKTWSAVTKVAAAMQWLLNAAIAANPVVLITLGIIALGVALVIAYKKSETFRNIVNAAFHAVQSVAGAVIGFIRDHWKILLVMLGGPFGAAVVIIINHFQTLKNVAGSVLDFVKDKWNTVTGAIRSAWGWVQNVIDKIGELIGAIGNIHFPDIPSLHIPGTAVGTNFARGGLTMVGERGPELVNMPRGSRVWPAAETRNMRGGGGGQPIIVYTTVTLDGKVLGTGMQKVDKDYRRQNGRGLFA